LERKLVSSWLLLLALGVVTLAFALLAPGLWSKSGKWILPLVVSVSVVLVLSMALIVVAIAVRIGVGLLRRKRP
jgi:hypothetical protein